MLAAVLWDSWNVPSAWLAPAKKCDVVIAIDWELLLLLLEFALAEQQDSECSTEAPTVFVEESWMFVDLFEETEVAVASKFYHLLSSFSHHFPSE
mmetsp:Transcript_54685/g.158255  ORF Transcript_54685/g.158255 Transcript_54685/m.158255 type:complete len:95 (-) Transcript_54685:87-371(-)